MEAVAFLIAAYVTNILTLNVAIGFIFYVYVTKKYYNIDNVFLKGWRVYLAMLLPLCWLAYVVADAYHAIHYIYNNYDKLDESIIIDKGVREWLDTITTIINAILLSGWEPKKIWKK